MPTTQEELAAKAEHVQKLREQVAAAETQRVVRENEFSNDVAMRQLEAEEARLQGQLDAAKHAAKVANVKAGATTLLDSVKEDKARADAFAKAQEAARAASGKSADDDDVDPEEVEREAVEKAAEANAKENAEGATHVPEGLAESTTTTDAGSSTPAKK